MPIYVCVYIARVTENSSQYTCINAYTVWDKRVCVCMTSSLFMYVYMYMRETCMWTRLTLCVCVSIYVHIGRECVCVLGLFSPILSLSPSLRSTRTHTASPHIFYSSIYIFIHLYTWCRFLPSLWGEGRGARRQTPRVHCVCGCVACSRCACCAHSQPHKRAWAECAAPPLSHTPTHPYIFYLNIYIFT